MQEPITRDEPVSYRIEVQGHLSRTWAGYLGGVDVSRAGEGDRTVTTLSGQALDQAALMGLLNSLYDLGLSLLTVEYQCDRGKEAAQD